MEDHDSLTRLQGLQADLIAFTESRLPTLERLWAELEHSIGDFRKLLDKHQKNEESRKKLELGLLKVNDEVEYEVNGEFRQEAYAVADELDLDAFEAARLILEIQTTSPDLVRPPSIGAIFHFHSLREALVYSLRLVFQQACDTDVEPEERDVFLQTIQLTMQEEEDKPAPKSNYWRRCVKTMEDIESWIKRLQDRLVSVQVIGESSSFASEILEYQRGSLVRQHENLSMILKYLVNLDYTSMEDCKHLTTRMASLDTFDEIVVHYVPILIEFASLVGTENRVHLLDARSMDLTFADTTEATRWKLDDLRGIADIFWLAEYSGRYADGAVGSLLPNVNVEKENEARADRVMKALQDGAFHFLLLLCSKIKVQLWHDPAKTGLVQYLLRGARIEREAQLAVSSDFADLLSDQLQIFVESLISNMPDTIRRLKAEEDGQRRNLALAEREPELALHLERFLTITAYAYSGSPAAALETFWTDPDSNMYGFLQWASKRQSTPRAAAFCEMFRAIAEDEVCADHAHRFLLEESVGGSSVKFRRGTSLNWTQIFSELGYYAERLRENSSTLSNSGDGPTRQISEPESALMLECYLRLISHVCGNSPKARLFMLQNAEFRLQEVLFDLCRSGIESRFKACAYQTLASLLSSKTLEESYSFWTHLDEWVCGGTQRSGPPKPPSSQNTSDAAIQARLRPIASGFEESNAFVRFLQALLEVPADSSGLNDVLPFPEQLGQNYRMTGVDQYVDFVLGTIMGGVLPMLEDQQAVWQLRCACLDFVRLCLSTFNEDLVIFANQTNLDVDGVIATSDLVTYVKLHPFARVMEWLFNDAVIAQLFAASHANPDLLSGSPADSPIVTSVALALQVIELVMRLQVTYFDIVRPIIKTQSAARSRQVANPTLASFEDAILCNLNFAVDLGLYVSTAFEHLTTISLHLLQRLAQTRKLAGQASTIFKDGRSHPSRLLAALQQADDMERITASFTAPIQLDVREIELGTESPGYIIKLAILDLLQKSLDMTPGRPTLAHCLLGFYCTDRTVSVAQDGPFEKGQSLFHAIARFYAETASPEPNPPTLIAIRGKMSGILRQLCKSPLTGDIVLSQLRESGFNEVVAIAQTPVTEILPMDIVTNPVEFLVAEAATNFLSLISEQAAYFEHQCLELISANTLQSATNVEKVRGSILGLTALPTGDTVPHASLFDLFAFYDEALVSGVTLGDREYFANIDFDLCLQRDAAGVDLYDLRLVHELLLLQRQALRKSNALEPVDDSATRESASTKCDQEFDELLIRCQAINRVVQIKELQQSTCRAWIQLVTVTLTKADLTGVPLITFIVKTMELILPKIDYAIDQSIKFILPLVKLLYALVNEASRLPPATIAQDRLSAALRTSVACIVQYDIIPGSPALREVAYSTLSRILSMSIADSTLLRSARKIIDAAGSRLFEIVTDDSLATSSTLRISSLIAISSLVGVAPHPTIRALSRLNFIANLVDGIRGIPGTFAEERTKSELQSLLSFIKSNLALLLRIAQDGDGAGKVVEAGLFGAVQDSGLFSADPELGDADSEEALISFYELLAAVLKIVTAVVAIKGERNEGITAAGRAFIQESRSCLVGVLKSGRKGEVKGKLKETLLEVEEEFTIVCWATGFLDYDETPMREKRQRMAFT